MFLACVSLLALWYHRRLTAVTITRTSAVRLVSTAVAPLDARFTAACEFSKDVTSFVQAEEHKGAEHVVPFAVGDLTPSFATPCAGRDVLLDKAAKLVQSLNNSAHSLYQVKDGDNGGTPQRGHDAVCAAVGDSLARAAAEFEATVTAQIAAGRSVPLTVLNSVLVAAAGTRVHPTVKFVVWRAMLAQVNHRCRVYVFMWLCARDTMVVCSVHRGTPSRNGH